MRAVECKVGSPTPETFIYITRRSILHNFFCVSQPPLVCLCYPQGASRGYSELGVTDGYEPSCGLRMVCRHQCLLTTSLFFKKLTLVLIKLKSVSLINVFFLGQFNSYTGQTTEKGQWTQQYFFPPCKALDRTYYSLRHS